MHVEYLLAKNKTFKQKMIHLKNNNTKDKEHKRSIIQNGGIFIAQLHASQFLLSPASLIPEH